MTPPRYPYVRPLPPAPRATPLPPAPSSGTPNVDHQRMPIGRTPRKSDKRRSGGFRLTRRDELILGFLIRYGVATYAQIAQLCGRPQDAIRHRIGQLKANGLVCVVSSELRYNLVFPTDEAAAVCGIAIAGKRPARTLLPHALAVSDAGIAFERRGAVTLSDRQLRLGLADLLHDRLPSDGEEFSTTYGANDPNLRHYFLTRSGSSSHVVPDLVVRDDADNHALGRATAVEIQLSRPNSQALMSTLAAYAIDNGRVFSTILYVAPHADVRHMVESTARRVGLSRLRVIARL